ncbi:MAG TPA: HNH endonuclease signature motif containing protein [Candidatus Rubrimentiphilum sp.]|nr:HNH endonuclease signature motif containing protein [Candidatus Rubrimentiphilum sp.]
MPEIFRVSGIVALMRHAVMSATYKPALLKALARISKRSDNLSISLEELGEEFAKMYWNQVVVYHLRQAASISKESEVIRLISKTSRDYGIRTFSELPEPGKGKIRAKMARILTINVLSAFHVSKPPDMPRLYDWSKGRAQIALTSEAHEFLRSNSAVLELIANYHWATFLEACNRLAPKVIQKVATDGARRGSLVPYLRILAEESAQQCFYCGDGFENGRGAVVDHVIPWSFLLEDPIWDLVLSCARCNSAKSDWLPENTFIDRLVRRNQGALRSRLQGKASMLFGAEDIERLYQAAISLEWPRFWSPP